jgi:hypothetical protein
MDHPESCGSQALEPSVGELLRLRQFLSGIEKLGEKELRELCGQLAHHVLVLHPSVVRFLVKEIAGAPFTAQHRDEIRQEVVAAVKKGASGIADAKAEDL